MLNKLGSDIKVFQNSHLCTLQSGEKVRLLGCSVLPRADLVKYREGDKLHPDAFFAIKVYFCKARLVSLAMSYNENSVNRQSIFKIIGLLEPVFLGGKNNEVA
jgi:hypothetical protein